MVAVFRTTDTLKLIQLIDQETESEVMQEVNVKGRARKDQQSLTAGNEPRRSTWHQILKTHP